MNQKMYNKWMTKYLDLLKKEKHYLKRLKFLKENHNPQENDLTVPIKYCNIEIRSAKKKILTAKSKIEKYKEE